MTVLGPNFRFGVTRIDLPWKFRVEVSGVQGFAGSGIYLGLGVEASRIRHCGFMKFRVTLLQHVDVAGFWILLLGRFHEGLPQDPGRGSCVKRHL